MSKKTFNIVISFVLICFSFYYTNKVINVSRINDPIMIEIIKYDEMLNDSKSEAILIDNSIIPGLKGEKIDIEKSYSKMKKVGKFDKNLLVFEETTPQNTIKNNYDNFIVSGNKGKNEVSIIMELQDTNYVEEFLNVINKKNITITFFVTEEIFNDNIDLIKLMIAFGNDVELLSNKYSIYEVNKYNSILKLVSDKRLNYCLNRKKDEELLDNCKESKLYSIVPTLESSTYLYNSIKNNLENGSIILIKNNKSTLIELSSSVNYILQKGKKIVPLKKLLEE